MRIQFSILLLLLLPIQKNVLAQDQYSLVFYGDSIRFSIPDHSFIDFGEASLSISSVQEFYNRISKADFSDPISVLKTYRKKYQPDDWLYYQLVRKMAQQISPKSDNYCRYTLYKWFFMCQSDYTPILVIGENKLLFYIECSEQVYNIPIREKWDKQFVCLNYHDYGSNIDFTKNKFAEVPIAISQGNRSFSYKINKLPHFEEQDYVAKNVQFSINENEYRFKIKVNQQIQPLFKNYPTVDYENYLNIPLSHDTYNTLIPALKKALKGKSEKQGVDYLMQLTRYAFAFEADSIKFGREKRFTPEQMLLFETSDCEDRVIFFFTLVKEIYNLPMIILSYPQHVSIAVNFDKHKGKPILYNGKPYFVCEPTPQATDLLIGQELRTLKNVDYEIIYSYLPNKQP
ncbi:MAG TPA: hypothetical protein PK191_03445 [Niabella sp.]|nr:hypothetical protein [Niabella sp.]HOZ95420.1 hypothetical protein [Niabella sp.]HQW14309.1 hypothetical protein [Niabella sp.]HQX18411.1 hypothetical protein [Niabella sp.]HQX40097.1 hypothetical protein [Niabella sp.]